MTKAKNRSHKNVRIVGISPVTVGYLQGSFFFLIGLVTAVTFWISQTAHFTEATESLLQGLTFGLAHGALALIIVPFVYFVIGWVVGLLQGIVLDAVIRFAGGLVVRTRNDDEE